MNPLMFMLLRMSSPAALQTAAGTSLTAAAENLTAALRQYTKTSDLGTAWTGVSSQAHQERVAKTAEAMSRVGLAIGQTAAITSTGAARMQALKVRNDATVASALAAGFQVLPTGQVVPGPAHYAKASGPHGAALMKLFWTIARLYTAQIKATVAQTSTVDAQVATTLATIAAEYFADLLQDKPDGVAAEGPASGRSWDPPTVPGLPVRDVEDDTDGTALAGAGALDGASVLAGGGIGVSGAGGAPTGNAAAVPAGLTGGAVVVAAPGRVVTGTGAAAGRGAIAGTPLMPLGTQGAGRGGEQGETQTWLEEDRDPWDCGDDAPGPVLS